MLEKNLICLLARDFICDHSLPADPIAALGLTTKVILFEVMMSACIIEVRVVWSPPVDPGSGVTVRYPHNFYIHLDSVP